MELNIAIVEDEVSEYENLVSLLNEYNKNKKHQFNFSYFSSGKEILSKYESKFDLILMDVDLKTDNGMNVAKLIRAYDADVLIVFVTNLRQYAIHGYEVGALNYILKPVNPSSLSLTMDRVLSLIHKSDDPKVDIHQHNEHFFVEQSDIIYFEVLNHVVSIHTVDKEYNVYSSLKNFEKHLGKSFVKVNNYAIVNVRYISYIAADTMVGDKEFKISRGQRKQSKAVIESYFRGVKL